ncbi:pectinesterase family protein [Microbulbifer halophilus]|uniref:Pectinesterase family protein n=1 Tax=Microbulbifer halophilus TaxID=453963 RepID=A0ABW5E8J7_9GAMM|nr:pectinesterase family protein [Microbulbifer halophilus]MCW8126843.1 pectinesterase family protein [Microbulbifer halophilus]
MRSLIILLSVLLFSSARATPEYQALVDPRTPIVENVYHTVSEAVTAAPADSDSPHIIYIRNGRYREKLTVTKPNINLVGESRDGVVLTYDAYAGQKIPGSEETWGTFRSATLTVLAPDFRAESLTVENAFDFLRNDALDKQATERVGGTQAVALAINGRADRSAFRDVKLSGYQDTLYVNTGRSYFLDSVIEGNVDFIFGAGTALFEKSDIVNRKRARDMQTTGYVTAPSTDIANDFGLVFLNCRLLKEEAVPADSVPLGRPWHPTTTFEDGRYADPDAIGASVFINTWMDDHIARDGWDSMNGTARDGSKSAVFTPESSRFFEYKSRGPGAAVNPERRQLDEEEAGNYNREKILDGWEPGFL